MENATDWSRENLILDKDDLMRITNLNRNTIYSWFHRSDFPSMKFGRRYVITREAFQEWLKKESWKQEFVSNYKDKTLEEQKEHEKIFDEAYIFIKNKMEDEEQRLQTV